MIIAIANQKGGTGKTTLALGLASAASAAGIGTLAVDMDPQANLTACLGITSAPDFSMNDVLYADQQGVAADAIVSTAWPHVDLIAAELALADRDADTQLGREYRLRKAFDCEEVRGYQLVLIDCQPSIGQLVSNALIAADSALIVTEPAVNASTGVANVLNTIERVRELYNPALKIAGVVMNKVPPRSREAQYRIGEIEQALGLWHPFIPVRTVLSEAQGAREPIHDYGTRAHDVTAIFDSYLDRLTKEN